VHDSIHISGVQGLQDSVCIADVRLDEREYLGGKVFDTLFFDRSGIERIEVINGRDSVAITQESTAEVTADETGATGNTNVHCTFCLGERLLG
jgi:hypothetical protein